VLASLGKLFRYEVIGDAPVGRGGCGHIWRAKDLLFDRPVALKTIDPPLLWSDADKAERTFRKEAIAGARLGELSNHVVRVIDLGRADETLYFAMEWIEPEAKNTGIDASALAGNVSLARAKEILFHVSDAVQTAHRNGIVHSDIAPWNIFFDSAKRLYKLADFGLLRIVEATLMSRGSGSLLQGGRLDFVPPSARSDISAIGYGTDVYALAATFRVLLEGFPRMSERFGLLSPPAVIRVKHENRDAPDAVRQLLNKFIYSYRPEQRIEEFVTMLQRVPN